MSSSTQSKHVVYDCNIFVQSMINPGGPAGRCIQKVRDSEVRLYVTPFILDEIRESWRKIPSKYGVTTEQVEAMATWAVAISNVIFNVPEVFLFARDPDDAHYVNLAIATNAELIVSRDRDLLDLMDLSREEGRSFKSRFPRLKIVDPVTMLREMEEAKLRQT